MKKEILEKTTKIEGIISDKEEAEKVMSVVSELIEMFTNKVVELSERQLKLEEKTEEIVDVLSQIEEEIIESFNNEFEAECPYCGEIIPFKIPENGEEFECPLCGNVIETEIMLEECGGCNGTCGEDDCSSCHGHEKEDNNKKKK